MSLPINVGTGTITGRFVIGVVDSPFDLDDDPELIPAQGRISFTPSISYVPNSANDFPMTIMKSTITGVLDDEGYLCTPDTMSPTGYTRGVKLFATDVGQVTNWTYTVKYQFNTTSYVTPNIPDHAISVPDGSTQDLTSLVRVPSSPGVGTPQMESTVLRIESLAQDLTSNFDEVKSVAQSVRDDADSGTFKGDKGDQGDVGPQGPPNNLKIGTVKASAGNPADDEIMSNLILNGDLTKAAIKQQIPIEMIGDKGDKGDPSEFELRGKGSPIGVVDAPRGTYYTDTEGTNGAWRYIKVSTSGNTAWTVVIGDTGWRSIIEEFSAMNDSRYTPRLLRIRRMSENVYLEAVISSPDNTFYPYVQLLDNIGSSALGWRFAGNYDWPANSANNNTILIGTGSTNSRIQAQVKPDYQAVLGGGLRVNTSWMTSDAWPTVTRGTPA